MQLLPDDHDDWTTEDKWVIYVASILLNLSGLGCMANVIMSEKLVGSKIEELL